MQMRTAFRNNETEIYTIKHSVLAIALIFNVQKHGQN